MCIELQKIEPHPSLKVRSKMLYTPGDFSGIRDEYCRNMLTDAYKAVTEANAWEIMAQDPGEGGFIYSKTAHKNLAKVNALIKYDGHSGASYGYTMRQMQYIATHGWEKYISALNS